MVLSNPDLHMGYCLEFSSGSAGAQIAGNVLPVAKRAEISVLRIQFNPRSLLEKIVTRK